MLTSVEQAQSQFANGPEFDALLKQIGDRALSFRKARRLADDIVAGFRTIGIYRAFVARRFGGLEITPDRFLETIETIADADGSAGWVASFGVSALYLAALPVQTLEAIYRKGPDVVFAGAIFPPCPAGIADGDLVVSGRWPYASGCTGADLLGVGVSLPNGPAGDGLPRTAVFPVEQARIDETWNTMGMAGTGSHDIVAEAIRVPMDWTFIRGGPSNLEGPIYRYPSLALAAQVLTVVGLGCARRALNEISAMAKGRKSITGAPVMADRPYVQFSIAEAEAMLSAARCFFYDVTRQAMAAAENGTPDEACAARIRLACIHAAQTSYEVARRCFELGGIAAVDADHILARCMQDCAVVAQHAFMARSNYEVAGRLILGRGGRPGYP
ncbi:MAG: acyl-CoA dehydrogenase family protein [Gluconacetobacter sp.]